MDWNNDGKNDLLSGDTKGQVWIFLNEGTSESPKLAKGVQVEAAGEPIVGSREKGKIIGIYSKLHYADFNGDGLKDLLVGQNAPAGDNLLFYKNIGTKSKPKLAKPEPIELPEPKMSRPSPYVVDFDGDGVVDLLFGTERSEVYFFRNAGTNEKPKLKKGRNLKLDGGEDFENSYRCRIDVTDWNNDGVLDILAGTFYSKKKPMGGNVWLFLGK